MIITIIITSLGLALTRERINLYSALSLFFCLCHLAYGILVPQPGIELRPTVVKVQSLNQGIPNSAVFSPRKTESKEPLLKNLNI